MNDLSNQSYRGVFVKLFGQKSRNFSRNMSAVELCFDKVYVTFLKQDSDIGLFLEPFKFYGTHSVEHM